MFAKPVLTGFRVFHLKGFFFHFDKEIREKKYREQIDQC